MSGNEYYRSSEVVSASAPESLISNTNSFVSVQPAISTQVTSTPYYENNDYRPDPRRKPRPPAGRWGTGIFDW